MIWLLKCPRSELYCNMRPFGEQNGHPLCWWSVGSEHFRGNGTITALFFFSQQALFWGLKHSRWKYQYSNCSTSLSVFLRASMTNQKQKTKQHNSTLETCTTSLCLHRKYTEIQENMYQDMRNIKKTTEYTNFIVGQKKTHITIQTKEHRLVSIVYQKCFCFKLGDST